MITGLEFMSISIINEVDPQDEWFNNSAKDLGSPIDVRNHPDLKYTLDHNKTYSLELKLEPEKKNSPSNPLLVTIPQLNQRKPGEVNGVFSQLKLNDIQSFLTLNSSSFSSQVALPMGLTWYFELQGSYNNLTLQPDWSVDQSFSLKKFVDWLDDEIFNPQVESKKSSTPARGIRVVVPNEAQNSPASLLELEQTNEIDQTPQYFLNLDNSVQALSNRGISSNLQFSWDANLNNVSLGVSSPLPGGWKDELELRNNNNLSEFLINYQAPENEWKSTVSVKYRLEINRDMKLELQNDYNLNNHENSTFIRWIEKY